MPDEVKGEALWCYVVLGRRRRRRPTSCGPSWCDSWPTRSGKSFRPSAVRFTDALPKTRSAKVLRRAIRAAAAGQRPRRPVVARGSGRPRRRARRSLRPAATPMERTSTLFGRRVMLRPLVAVGLRGVARGAAALRATGSLKWEPQRLPGQPDTDPGPRRVRRARAAPASASASSAPGTASGSSSTARSAARSTSRRSSGARSRAPTSATGSTRSGPARGYMPEALVVLARFAFEELHLHRIQVVDHPPQRGQPAGGREARPPRRGRRRCATWRSTASGRTTSATPSPPRSGSERRDELAAAWLSGSG